MPDAEPTMGASELSLVPAAPGCPSLDCTGGLLWDDWLSGVLLEGVELPPQWAASSPRRLEQIIGVTRRIILFSSSDP
jgi:hypothetical protein